MDWLRVVQVVLLAVGIVVTSTGFLYAFAQRYWTRWSDLSALVLDDTSLIWIWLTPNALELIESTKDVTPLPDPPDWMKARVFTEMCLDRYLELATAPPPIAWFPPLRRMAQEVRDTIRNPFLAYFAMKTGLVSGYDPGHREKLKKVLADVKVRTPWRL
jgi:hypothetical protein